MIFMNYLYYSFNDEMKGTMLPKDIILSFLGQKMLSL